MSRKNHVKVDGKLLQTYKRLWIRLERITCLQMLILLRERLSNV